MKYRVCWCLLFLALLLAAWPACADGDDDGGTVLDPTLQWQLADNAWNRRNYEDAAALLTTFATANPDHDNALEALWRAYQVYTTHRPNPERRKKAFETAMNACERWEQKFAGKHLPNYARSFWYRALLQERQGDKQAGIRCLQDLVAKAIGTTLDQHVFWTLAEWQSDCKRYQDAIANYSAYRQLVGTTDQAALACIRQASCHLQLKDDAGAVAAYKEVLDGKYNWGGGNLSRNAMSVAQQLRTMGEEELARAFAMKLLEKGPKREELQSAARLFLGDKVSKRIVIYPYFHCLYSTSNTSIDSRTKLDATFSMDLAVRLNFVSAEEPFEGVLRVVPKQQMARLPAAMNVEDANGVRACTASFKAPDAKGNVAAETRFRFEGGTAPAETPMDNLVITRKWEKAGKTWGESTIRIQSSERWDLTITLPNALTSPDNITPKPYSVSKDGTTFSWPRNTYDPAQGVTFTMPVEVNANTREFYPALSLSRSVTPPFGSQETNLANPTFDFRWFTISMNAAAAFPCTFAGQAWATVKMAEVVK